MVLALAAVAAFLVSLVFAMFGQGGGSLYTPIFFLLGFSVLAAISTSLTLNLLTALSATLVYRKAGFVEYPAVLLLVPGIGLGSFLGALVSGSVDSHLIMWIFVAFLVAAGARMVLSFREAEPPRPTAEFRLDGPLKAVSFAFSLAVGLISGLLGVGGGILIVPFLIYAAKMPTKRAAGTAAFVVVFSSLFGILGYSMLGHVDLPLLIVAGTAVVLGASLGARYMVRASAPLIRVGFGFLLWAFGVQLVLRLLGII